VHLPITLLAFFAGGGPAAAASVVAPQPPTADTAAVSGVCRVVVRRRRADDRSWDAAPYATPLRGPAPLPGREKSGVGGTGIMTGETGAAIQYKSECAMRETDLSLRPLISLVKYIIYARIRVHSIHNIEHYLYRLG
jgi:hypothetical protein